MIQSYSRIWALLTRVERSRFVIVVCLTVVMAIFDLVTVASILPFVRVLTQPDLVETHWALIWFADVLGLETFEQVAVTLGICVLVLVVVGMSVRAAVTYVQIRFALGRGYSLAARLLQRHLGRDYSWYLGRNTATLSQGLLSEVDLVVSQSILPAVMLISNTTTLLLIGGFLFYVEPAIALGVMSLLIGVYIVVFLLLRKRIARAGRLRMGANKVRFKVVQEVTGSLKDIKVMGLERGSLKRFRRPAFAMVRYQTAGLLMARLPRFALEATIYGGFVAMLLVLIVQQSTSLEDLLPILGLLAVSAFKLFPALQQIYVQVNSLQMSRAVLGRLYEDMHDLDDAPDLPERDGEILPLEQAIAFEAVGYRYPEGESDTMDDFCLTIPARTSVGLVGSTGAGKTTTVDLLLGLLHPGRGRITIDGVPLTRDTIRAWQRNIGYVPQVIFLADDTVAANIAFGLAPEDIDMACVERAARAANLHSFVTGDLTQGYDTLVGERGLRLSGGQRQRIGIARALYFDPDVLILDEATSALDNLTERAVMEALQALGGQKTIIMIAHRLTTVQGCDKIVLMERGRITGEGPYDALLEDSDTFRRMVHD